SPAPPPPAPSSAATAPAPSTSRPPGSPSTTPCATSRPCTGPTACRPCSSASTSSSAAPSSRAGSWACLPQGEQVTPDPRANGPQPGGQPFEVPERGRQVARADDQPLLHHLRDGAQVGQARLAAEQKGDARPLALGQGLAQEGVDLEQPAQ